MKLQDAVDQIADALRPLDFEIPGIQVYAGRLLHPTPPTLDVYPGDPFQTGAGFGVGNSEVFWTVRARVGSNDMAAANELLLRLLDPNDPASVEAALQDVATVVPEGVSGVGEYEAAANERMLGCEWRVAMFL